MSTGRLTKGDVSHQMRLLVSLQLTIMTIHKPHPIHALVTELTPLTYKTSQN